MNYQRSSPLCLALRAFSQELKNHKMLLLITRVSLFLALLASTPLPCPQRFLSSLLQTLPILYP